MESSDEQIQSELVSDLVVDGILRFLRGFFSTFPYFTWSEDDTQSQLQITDFDAYNLDAVDKRPRIAVELIEGHWENIMVNAVQGKNLIRRTTTLSDMVKASVTLHCICKEGVEAKRLADIVFEAVRLFREELRREAGFFNVDSVHRGREQRIISDSQSVTRVVPVELNVQVQRTMIKIDDNEVFEATAP